MEIATPRSRNLTHTMKGGRGYVLYKFVSSLDSEGAPDPAPLFVLVFLDRYQVGEQKGNDYISECGHTLRALILT